jgi:chromosome segregation ATPase
MASRTSSPALAPALWSHVPAPLDLISPKLDTLPITTIVKALQGTIHLYERDFRILNKALKASAHKLGTLTNQSKDLKKIVTIIEIELRPMGLLQEKKNVSITQAGTILQKVFKMLRDNIPPQSAQLALERGVALEPSVETGSKLQKFDMSSIEAKKKDFQVRQLQEELSETKQSILAKEKLWIRDRDSYEKHISELQSRLNETKANERESSSKGTTVQGNKIFTTTELSIKKLLSRLNIVEETHMDSSKDFENEVHKLSNYIDDLLSENKKVLEDNSMLKADLERSVEENKNLSTDKSHLLQKLEQAQKVNEELKTDNGITQQRLAELTLENSLMKQGVEELESEMRKDDKNVITLEDGNAKQCKPDSSETLSLSSHDDFSGMLNRIRRVHVISQENNQHAISNLEHELQETKKMTKIGISELSHKYNSLIEQTEKDISKLESEVEYYQSVVSRQSSSIQELTSKLQENETLVSGEPSGKQLQEDCKELKLQRIKAEDRLLEVEEEKAELDKENLRLKSVVQEKEEQILSYRDQVHFLREREKDLNSLTVQHHLLQREHKLQCQQMTQMIVSLVQAAKLHQKMHQTSRDNEKLLQVERKERASLQLKVASQSRDVQACVITMAYLYKKSEQYGRFSSVLRKKVLHARNELIDSQSLLNAHTTTLNSLVLTLVESRRINQTQRLLIKIRRREASKSAELKNNNLCLFRQVYELNQLRSLCIAALAESSKHHGYQQQLLNIKRKETQIIYKTVAAQHKEARNLEMEVESLQVMLRDKDEMLNDVWKQYEEEVHELNKRLKEATDEASTLRLDKSQLQDLLTESKDSFQELTDKLNEALATINNLNEEKIQNVTRIADVLSKINQHRAQVSELSVKLQDKDIEIQQMHSVFEEEVDHLTSSYNSTLEENSEAIDQLKTENNKLRNVVEDMKKWELETQELSHALLTKQKELEEVIAQLRESRHETSVLQLELKENQETLVQYECTIESLKDESNLQSNYIENSEGMIKSLDDKQELLQSQMSQLQNSFNNQAEELNHHKKQLNELKQEKAELISKCQDYEKNTRELNSKWEQINGEKRNIEASLQQILSEKKQKEKEFVRLSRWAEKHKALYTEQEKDNTQLKVQKHTLSKELELVHRLLDNLKKSLHETEKEVAAKDQSLEECKLRNHELEEELQHLSNQLMNVQQTNLIKSQEMEKLRAEVENNSTTIEAQKERIEELSTELNGSLLSLDGLRKDNSALKEAFKQQKLILQEKEKELRVQGTTMEELLISFDDKEFSLKRSLEEVAVLKASLEDKKRYISEHQFKFREKESQLNGVNTTARELKGKLELSYQECEALKLQLQDSLQELKQKSETIVSHTEQLQNSQSMLRELESTKANQIQFINEQKEEITKLQKLNEELKSQLLYSLKKISSIEESHAKQSDTIVNLEKQREELKKHIESLTSDIEEQNSVVSKSKDELLAQLTHSINELKTLKLERGQLLEAKLQLEKGFQEVLNKKEELERESKDQKEFLSKLQSQVKQLEKKYEHEHKELLIKKSMVSNLEDKIQDLKGENEMLMNTISLNSSLSAKNLELETDYSQTRMQLKERETEIQNLRQENVTLHVKYEEFERQAQRELEYWQSQLTEANATYDSRKSEEIYKTEKVVAELRALNNKLQLQVKGLSDEVQQKETIVTEGRRSAQQLQEDVLSLSRELETKKKQLEMYKNDYSALVQKIHDFEGVDNPSSKIKQLSSAQLENASLKEEYERLQYNFTLYMQEKESESQYYKEEIHTLKEDSNLVQQLKSKVLEYEKESVKRESELGDMSSQLKDKNVELESLRLLNTNLEKLLDSTDTASNSMSAVDSESELTSLRLHEARLDNEIKNARLILSNHHVALHTFDQILIRVNEYKQRMRSALIYLNKKVRDLHKQKSLFEKDVQGKMKEVARLLPVIRNELQDRKEEDSLSVAVKESSELNVQIIESFLSVFSSQSSLLIKNNLNAETLAFLKEIRKMHRDIQKDRLHMDNGFLGVFARILGIETRLIEHAERLESSENSMFLECLKSTAHLLAHIRQRHENWIESLHGMSLSQPIRAEDVPAEAPSLEKLRVFIQKECRVIEDCLEEYGHFVHSWRSNKSEDEKLNHSSQDLPVVYLLLEKSKLANYSNTLDDKFYSASALLPGNAGTKEPSVLALEKIELTLALIERQLKKWHNFLSNYRRSHLFGSENAKPFYFLAKKQADVYEILRNILTSLSFLQQWQAATSHEKWVQVYQTCLLSVNCIDDSQVTETVAMEQLQILRQLYLTSKVSLEQSRNEHLQLAKDKEMLQSKIHDHQLKIQLSNERIQQLEAECSNLKHRSISEKTLHEQQVAFLEDLLQKYKQSETMLQNKVSIMDAKHQGLNKEPGQYEIHRDLSSVFSDTLLKRKHSQLSSKPQGELPLLPH